MSPAQKPDRVLFLSCAAAALVALTPYAAGGLGVELPDWLQILLLPLSEGLHYLSVAVHEPGHAFCHWLFGEPAFPTFDAVHGGGMTYSAGRSAALTAFIYFLMVSTLVLLWRASKRRAAVVLALFIPLHAWLISSGFDQFVTLVMGQGAEMIAAAALLAFGLARPDKLKTAPERAVALTASLYMFGRNAILCANLLLNESIRAAYANQKGIPNLGDYQHAALVAGVPVQAVAGGMAVFLLLCAMSAAVYIRRKHSRKASGFGVSPGF